MSKIESLKLRLDGSRMAINASNEFIAKERETVAQIEKELAALEAEASKPDEWIFNCRHTGRQIVLIEKLPVRVTKEMAGLFRESLPRGILNNYTLAAGLEKIGIDAIAAD